MVAKIGVRVDPGGKFGKLLKEAAQKSGDLRQPFKEITASWYKTNKIHIFNLKGPGKYTDLSEKPFYAYWLSPNNPKTSKILSNNNGSIYFKQGYKDYKVASGYKLYPILKASGKLMKSLTIPTDRNTIASVLNKRTLILGTKVESKKGAPYPTYLNFGTKKMPARPFMFIGTGSGKMARQPWVKRRLKAWTQQIETHLTQTLAKGKK